jgi:glycosyltransferase involved in cell wall biosynthesis
MIEPGSTGVLVKPHAPEHLADALARMVASPRQALTMGRAARREAEHRFDIDRQAMRLADEYRVLVARRQAA